MKVKEGMYMKKILEAIKNFFSASHERERKEYRRLSMEMFNNFVLCSKADMAVKQSVYYSNDCNGSIGRHCICLLEFIFQRLYLALVEN